MHYSRYLRKGDPLARNRGEVVDGCRVCPRCKVDRPLEDYSPRNNICKPCKAEHKRLRALADPEVREARRLYSVAYNAAHAEGQRARVRAWRAANPEIVRKHSSARRAAVRGSQVEDFLPVDVFERDGWTCHLCGDPVDREAQWPHPASVSLDHIIPLSRGGAHTTENTACSHLRCNQKKYNSTSTQQGVRSGRV